MSIHYIETTIPSFYHEVRTEPSMVARRDWIRRWFDPAIASDRIVSSVAVLDELRRCDFLVTWNCQHLANANKFGQIRRINGILGLFVPELVTPMELLGENAGP